MVTRLESASDRPVLSIEGVSYLYGCSTSPNKSESDHLKAEINYDRQTGMERTCFSRGEPKKVATAVSTESLPAPKIKTMSETIRKAKGAAAMNLSGSEKKDSSASRSPIT